MVEFREVSDGPAFQVKCWTEHKLLWEEDQLHPDSREFLSELLDAHETRYKDHEVVVYTRS